MTTSTAPNPPGETTLRPPEPPRFHSGKTFFWGVVLILFVGFLAWFAIGYLGEGSFQDIDQKRVIQRQDILQKRNAADTKLLNDPPSYLDKAKGKIRVPINEAMKLALTALQSNKPHPAYPLSEDPPQPAASGGTPAPGASPAAGASPSPGTTTGTAAPATSAPAAKVAPAPAAAPSPSAPPAAVGTTSSTSAPTPVATDNALNPGSPPSNGAPPQPSPSPAGNTETSGGSPAPSGAQLQPLTNPALLPTPSVAPGGSPSPNADEPGATPGGTP